MNLVCFNKYVLTLFIIIEKGNQEINIKIIYLMVFFSKGNRHIIYQKYLIEKNAFDLAKIQIQIFD